MDLTSIRTVCVCACVRAASASSPSSSSTAADLDSSPAQRGNGATSARWTDPRRRLGPSPATWWRYLATSNSVSRVVTATLKVHWKHGQVCVCVPVWYDASSFPLRQLMMLPTATAACSPAWYAILGSLTSAQSPTAKTLGKPSTCRWRLTLRAPLVARQLAVRGHATQAPPLTWPMTSGAAMHFYSYHIYLSNALIKPKAQTFIIITLSYLIPFFLSVSLV